MNLKRLIGLAIIVGVISGIGAFVFYALLELIAGICMNLAGLQLPKPGGEPPLFEFHFNIKIAICIITALGAFIAGLIVYTFAPETQGDGTDATIRTFHYFRGIIRGRVSIIKIITSAITIGSGGSAGREGPITQIGAGFGSTLATILKLPDKERRLLLICGIAGGLGSIFRAPLGGALFAVEVLYKKDFETQAVIPAFVSSIVAYTVFISIFKILGVNSLNIFTLPSLSLDFKEIPLYILVGVISAILVYFFVKIFYGVHNFFKNLKISNYFKPLIGGFITGIIGMFLPSVLGTGYGYVQELIYGGLPLTFIVLTVFGKIIATSFTLGSGGSGGVFGPSVVIGGFIGGTVGYFFKQYIPTIHPETYVLLGIASFISAACKTPLTAILMTSEMTGGYQLLPALMVSSTIAYLLSKEWSIYHEQLLTQIDSPAHRMEMIVDILQNIKVKDAMTPNPLTVDPDDNIEKVISLIEKTGHHGYPVAKDGKLVGVITFTDLEKIKPEERAKIKVKEIMTEKPITTSPEEDLKSVLDKMLTLQNISATKLGKLPVVKDGKLIGILTKGDIIRAYAKERKKYFS